MDFSEDLIEEGLEYLYRKAKTELVFYSDMCREIKGTRFFPDEHRFHLYLAELSRREHEAGRPMITALVIGKESNKPGRGFFELAEFLKELSPCGDEDEFWLAQLEKIRRTPYPE